MTKSQLELALSQTREQNTLLINHINTLTDQIRRANKPKDIFVLYINNHPKVSYFGPGAWKLAHVTASNLAKQGWPTRVERAKP